MVVNWLTGSVHKCHDCRGGADYFTGFDYLPGYPPLTVLAVSRQIRAEIFLLERDELCILYQGVI